MSFLVIQIQSLYISKASDRVIGVEVKIGNFQDKKGGQQSIKRKQINQFQRNINKKQIIYVDLGQANPFFTSDIFNFQEIEIFFSAVSRLATYQKEYILFHSQKLKLRDLFHKKKFVRKSLDFLFGKGSLIQFAIQIDSKCNIQQTRVKGKKGFQSDQYQMNVTSSKQLMRKMTINQDISSSPKIFISQPQNFKQNSAYHSLNFKGKDQSHLIKDFNKDLNREKPIIGAMKSYDFEKNYGLEQQCCQNIFQKTFKIQHKNKLFENLSKEKQKLKNERRQINSTVRSLSLKIDNLQRKNQKLELKSISSEKQLKNSLKQKRQLNQKQKTLQQEVESKNKKIKQLQKKISSISDTFTRKETSYKFQLKNIQQKMSEMANDKQKMEFEIEQLRQLLREKERTFNTIKTKAVIEQQQQFNELKLKKQCLQRQLTKYRQNTTLLTQQCQVLNKKITILSSELTNKINSQQQTKEFISNQAQQIRRLNEYILSLKVFKQQSKQKEQKLNQKQREFLKKVQQVDQQQADINKLTNQLNQAKLQIEQLKDSNKSLKNALNQNKKSITSLTYHKKNLSTQLINLEESNFYLSKKYTQNLEDLESERKQNDKKYEKFNDQLSACRKQLKNNSALIDQLDVQNRQLKEELQKIKKIHHMQRQNYANQINKFIEEKNLYLKEIQVSHEKLKLEFEQKKRQQIQQVKLQQEKKWKLKQASLIREQRNRQVQLKQNHEKNMKQLRQKMDKLSAQMVQALEKKQKAIKKLYEQLRNKQSSMNQIEQELIKHRSIEDKYLKQIEALKLQLTLKEKQLQQVSQKSQLKANQLTNLINQMTQTLEHNQTFQKQLKIQIQQQKIQINLLKHQNYQLSTSLNQLHSLKLQLQEKYLQISKMNAELRERNAELRERQTLTNKQTLQNNQNQKQLQSKVQNLQLIIQQKIKAIQQIQNQYKSLKDKENKLIELAKNQLAAHCKTDNKKLISVLQRFQKLTKQLKYPHQSTTISLENAKKIDSLQTQLQNHKKVALNYTSQLKAKQIQIQGIKVKYQKYKQENQKLSTDFQLTKRQLKKFKSQSQNILISLAQTKKHLTQLQDQFLNKAITIKSPKIGNCLALLKDSIRKVQAFTISSSNVVSVKYNINSIDVGAINMANGTKLPIKQTVQSKSQQTEIEQVNKAQNKRSLKQPPKLKEFSKLSKQVVPQTQTKDQQYKQLKNQLQRPIQAENLIGPKGATPPSSKKNQTEIQEIRNTLDIEFQKSQIKSNISNKNSRSERQRIDKRNSDIDQNISIDSTNKNQLMMEGSFEQENNMLNISSNKGQSSKESSFANSQDSQI